MSRRAAPLVIAVVSLVAAACDSTEPRGPGSIFVTSSVASPEPGASFFQYNIIVDNGSPRIANVFESVSLFVNGLAPGAHEVRLDGVPTYCDAGSNPRAVTLRGEDTALVVFNIACQRVTGDLRVNITTTGQDQDLDGYVLIVGSATAAFLASNGQFTIPFVAAGNHTLTLTDIADNCTANGPPNVTITAGQLSTVTFTVTCTPVAVLKVVSTTTGEDVDVDGFAVSTGSAASAVRVPAVGTAFMRINTGTVNWQLTDIQPNCTPTGSTSGSATVAAGDTVTIEAAATCTSIGYGSAGTTANDAAADTLSNGASNPSSAHDVVQMTARYAPNWLIVVARFAKPVGSLGTGPGGLYAVIDFDLDESVATGAQPLINAFGGSANQGSDKRIVIDEGQARLLTALPTDTLLHLVPMVMEGDSVMLKIPLEKLANDDGSLSITAVIGTADRPTDIMPNSGVFLARPSASLLANGSAVSVGGPASASLMKGPITWPPSQADYRRE